MIDYDRKEPAYRTVVFWHCYFCFFPPCPTPPGDVDSFPPSGEGGGKPRWDLGGISTSDAQQGGFRRVCVRVRVCVCAASQCQQVVLYNLVLLY